MGRNWWLRGTIILIVISNVIHKISSSIDLVCGVVDLTFTTLLSSYHHKGCDSEMLGYDEGKSDKEILDNLVQTTRYDKRLLPPVDGTLTVNMSVLLLSLASPDESSLKTRSESSISTGDGTLITVKEVSILEPKFLRPKYWLGFLMISTVVVLQSNPLP
ncbi:hypothetical protein PGB90_007583 [Kerria lacca]